MATGTGGVDVGYYAIPIIPSFEGIEAKINEGFGNRFSAAGTKAGQDIGKGIAGGIDANEARVKAALDKYNALYNRHADALGKVRVEQAKLDAEKAKGQQNDLKILAQTEKLEAARRKEIQTLKLATDQHKLYDEAQKRSAATGGTGGLSGLATAGDRVFTSLTRATGAMGPLGGALSSAASSASGLGGSMLAAGEGAGVMAGGVGAATVGLGALIAAVPAVVGGLYEIGASFNEMSNEVAFKTGTSGDALGKLTESVDTIAKKTPASISTIGGVVAEVTRSLHLSGGDLDEVAQSITNLNVKTGEATNIRDLGKAFRGFGVDAKDQNDALNQLYTASTQTGQSVNDLIHAVTVGGAPLRELGMDFGHSAALMSAFENAGLDGTKMVTGLRKAVAEFAKEHKDIPTALKDSVTQLKGFAEAAKNGDTAAGDMGVTLSNKLFGARTGVQFWDAIKSGALDLDSLNNSMQATTISINEQADATETAGEKWQKLKNNLEVAVQPIATKIFDIAQSGLTDLTAWIDTHHAAIIHFFTDIGVAGIRAFQGIALVLGPTLEGLGNIVSMLKTVSDWTGIGSVIDLGDAPQKMEQFGAALGHIGGQGGDDVVAKLQAMGNAAADSSKLTDALGQSVTSLKTAGQDVTIDIKDNTPEVQGKLHELGMHLEQMANDPTTLKIVPDTPAATTMLDTWRAGQNNTPLTPTVKPQIDPNAKEQFDAFFHQFVDLKIHPVPDSNMQPGPNPSGAPDTGGPGVTPGGWTHHARGAIDVWDRVASFANGGLPNSAIIQSPVPGGLVNWAEPSTGGEAYIPLAPSNRDRSQQIWKEVGKRLGMLQMDQGGITAYDNLIAEAQGIGDGRSYDYGGVGPNFDCSGAQSDLYAVLMGKPTGTRYFDTESNFEALGFKKGYMPGAWNIGIHRGGGGMSSHMASTLPNGVNFESGGSTNKTVYGKGASGANDPQFELHYYLAAGGNPTGEANGAAGGPGGSNFNSAGYYSPGGGAGGGGGGGGAAGTGPGGKAGHYVEDPIAVQKAQERVDAADAKEKEAEAKLNEHKKKETQADIDKKNEELRKAKEEQQIAQEELAKAKQGKFVADPTQKGTTGGTKGTSAAAGQNPGEILMGGILQTFGLDGSWLPDIKNLGIVKLLSAIMKIGYTPQGDGSFTGGLIGGTTGSTAASGTTTGGGGGDPIAALLGLPLGMIPNAMAPGPPPAPVGSTAGDASGQPGSVDQSTNITINNPQGDPHTIAKGTRQALLNTPRVKTYEPIGGG